MKAEEYITLEENIANLESCLNSKDWLEVRGGCDAGHGRTLAEAFEAELAAARAELEEQRCSG